MSQAKVDKYKKEKANRKKIMAKEKRERFAAGAFVAVIAAAIVGWAGVTAYSYYEASRPTYTYYCDLSSLNDYFNSLTE